MNCHGEPRVRTPSLILVPPAPKSMSIDATNDDDVDEEEVRMASRRTICGLIHGSQRLLVGQSQMFPLKKIKQCLTNLPTCLLTSENYKDLSLGLPYFLIRVPSVQAEYH